METIMFHSWTIGRQYPQVGVNSIEGSILLFQYGSDSFVHLYFDRFIVCIDWWKTCWQKDRHARMRCMYT